MKLKWPNDLLLDRAKVAGLLLEAHRLRERSAFAVVIGFGVNVASAPEGTPYPAAALAAAAPGLALTSLMSALARSFADRFAAWRSANGDAAQRFAATGRDWMRRAVGLGESVTVRLPSGERSGRFAGLDSIGRLRLQTSTGVELIDAGDLYFSQLRPSLAAHPSPPTR